MNKKLIKTWSRVFESDLAALAIELKKSLNTPALVILEGTLGAGKTTLVKNFSDHLISPTYSVLSESGNILHGDFYRLENSEEIVHLELPLYLEGKDFFFLEWGAKFFNEVSEELESDFSPYLVEIEIDPDEKSRRIHLSEIF